MARLLPAEANGGWSAPFLVAVVAAAVVVVTVLAPALLRQAGASRARQAERDAETIAGAIVALHTDTSHWPYTDAPGPTGNEVARLVGSSTVPTDAAPDAASGADGWGRSGKAKMLGDYLYWNNPDEDSHADGLRAGQAGEDYAATGPRAWQGPYLDRYELEDPWGNAYVVNVRFLPGGSYHGGEPHRVLVLSAGPDGRWSTSFGEGAIEEIQGDDVGHVLASVLPRRKAVARASVTEPTPSEQSPGGSGASR